MIKRLIASLGAVLMCCSAAITPALAAPAHATVSLTGAGSTFVFPYFDKAFSVYQGSHDVKINYSPIGSGAGIQQFINKTVDFGATDVPMDPSSELPQAVKAGGPVQQIPIALGGVSIAYNVPGVKSGLHLTGPVVADIFLGLIQKWNDKAIRKLNPKVKLPSQQIIPVHRSDGSGTSFIFTNYLSKVSDEWNGRIGTSKLPPWPASVGVAQKGNSGVADTVRSTPGAIGYIELAYVLQNHMTQATLRNASGKWVTASLSSVAAAAAAFPHVTAHKFSIVNAKGAKAYPIAGYTWVLLYRHQADGAKGKALVNLMTWTLTSGQKYARNLDYVPLPKAVVSLGTSALKTVH